MEKINLEEIIDRHRIPGDHWADQDFTETSIRQICMDFGQQLLELAAENAEGYFYDDAGYKNYAFADKQSILNTINKIE